jgi:hypothetical protein
MIPPVDEMDDEELESITNWLESWLRELQRE